MILKRLKLFLPTVFFAGIFALIVLIISAKTSYGIDIILPGTSRSTTSLASYIRNLFIFGLSLAGFLAVAAIAWGGILWMMGGSITSLEKAKGIIVGAISGLVLLMSSYLLLYTIDPKLTDLTPGTMQMLRNPTPIPNTNACPATGTCPDGKYCDPSTNRCTPMPPGYDRIKCKDPNQCRMENCMPGGTCSGMGSPGRWESSRCECDYSF